MTTTYDANGALAALTPAAYGGVQALGAAPSIGAEPKPYEASRVADDVEAQTVEGVDEEIAFALGARSSARAISWTCAVNRGNTLHYNGAPFRARYLAWSVTDISWQAGLGFPVFTSYCPAPDYDYRFKFPAAKRFQIVPVFGGHHWIGCSASASGTGNTATPVEFWVNDFPDTYGDNAGTFRVTVTGWAL